MSLEDKGSIDIVLRLPGVAARAALVAYDTTAWTDDAARERALEAKLTAYHDYVASGQFREQYPGLADCEPCIIVVCRENPTAGMLGMISVSEPNQSAIALPVAVTTDAEFRATLRSS